jgi:hypothetical protein
MQRIRRALVPAAVVLATTVVGAAHAAGGPVGGKVHLQSNIALSGYDAATTKDGTTYVGWIASSYNNTLLRQVHLCVLHQGSGSCVGGVQTANSLAPAAAQDLHVVVAGGQVALVWDAQAAPSSGDFSGIFGVAKVSNGHLGASTAISGAPTYPTMTSVIVTKSGGVSAAVIGNSSNDNKVYYYKTLSSAPKTLTRPYFIGNAQLADNGHQTVLTTSQYGSLSGRVSVAHKSSSSSSWSGFSTVTHSYTGGNIEKLYTAHGKIWMLGMSDKALYTPYRYRWSGKKFGGPKSTGDHQDVSSFDPTTDASGRLANVSTEVGNLAVSNFSGGSKAGEFRMKVKQTFAGGIAQVTTSPSGHGWLIYSIQTDTSTGDLLYAQRIRLSGLTRTVHQHGKPGKVSLTGPASCMPASPVHVALTGKGARPWKVAARKLTLGSKKVGSSLNGATLKPHHHYTLTGKVTFKNGGHHATLKAKLGFTTCGRP